MKKMLAISGSPRPNGNTDILLAKTIEGAQEEGAACETVFLRDLSIRECDGCHACWKISQCKHRDDMVDMYHKIEASDILVFGTPVYWYGPTGLMKMFMDRFVFFNSPSNRLKITEKWAVITIPYEETDPETVRPVVDFFRRSLQYLKVELAGMIIAPGAGRKGEVLGQTEILKEAYEMGKRMIVNEMFHKIGRNI